jgi:prefoldin beta subunit
MSIDSETERKIQEAQAVEQNLQNLLMQKQTIQVELGEIENALSELAKSSGEVYKIVGGLMIRSEKSSLLKELEEKKHLLELRISSIEKQEKIFGEKAENLRKELTNLVSKQKN